MTDPDIAPSSPEPESLSIAGSDTRSAAESAPSDTRPSPRPASGSSLSDGVPQRLDPAFVPYERLSGWVTAGVVFVLGPLVLGGMVLAGDPKPGKLVVVASIWIALVALFVTTTLVFPRLRFERARWTLSRAGLEIRTGVVFRELTSVPRSRVQHLDVTQGPIQRKFGLATLVVHTAGQQHSEVELSGVAHEVALAIRDDLMATGAGDGA